MSLKIVTSTVDEQRRRARPGSSSSAWNGKRKGKARSSKPRTRRSPPRRQKNSRKTLTAFVCSYARTSSSRPALQSTGEQTRRYAMLRPKELDGKTLISHRGRCTASGCRICGGIAGGPESRSRTISSVDARCFRRQRWKIKFGFGENTAIRCFGHETEGISVVVDVSTGVQHLTRDQGSREIDPRGKHTTTHCRGDRGFVLPADT